MEKLKGELVPIGPSLGLTKDRDLTYKAIGENADQLVYITFDLELESDKNMFNSSRWTYVQYVPDTDAELKVLEKAISSHTASNENLIKKLKKDLYYNYSLFSGLSSESHNIAKFGVDEKPIIYKVALGDGTAVEIPNGADDHEIFNQELHAMQAAVFSGEFEFEYENSHETNAKSFREWPSDKKIEPYDL